MPRPTTKADLLAACDAEHDRLLSAVDGLPDGAVEAEFAFEDRDRCVRDVLGHLHAWHLMVLAWDEEGRAGGTPAVPGPGYTWRTLPDLNRVIWQRCQDVDLVTTRADLDRSHRAVRALIESRTEEELFGKRHYAWTGTTSLGAYLVSCTSSHDVWALKKIRTHARTWVADGPAAEGPPRSSAPPVSI
jgi:hypothetical protein